MLFALNIPALAPQCANIMETLEDQEGCQFLKIAPSNYTINKLICGAGKRTSSLSNGDRLGQLKELRNKKLAGGVGPEDWQQEHCEKDGGPSAKKQRMSPTTVDIQVGDATVTLLCPQKRPQSADIMVKVNADQLTAVFDYLQSDCEASLPTRTYTRSGKFSKKRTEEEDIHE